MIKDDNDIDTIFHGFEYWNTTSFDNPVILQYRLILQISIFLILYPFRFPLKFVEMNNGNIEMTSESLCECRFPRSPRSNNIDTHNILLITLYFTEYIWYHQYSIFISVPRYDLASLLHQTLNLYYKIQHVHVQIHVNTSIYLHSSNPHYF